MRIQSDYIKRTLDYLTIEDNWKSNIPDDNWCLVLIANATEEFLIDEIIGEAISNNVGYICGIGQQHDYIHNQSDIEYVNRDLGDSQFPRPKYHVMTVGDEDFEEGIWFGFMCTFNGDVDIDKITILDVEGKQKTKLIDLIETFEKGYIPENEQMADDKLFEIGLVIVESAVNVNCQDYKSLNIKSNGWY